MKKLFLKSVEFQTKKGAGYLATYSNYLTKEENEDEIMIVKSILIRNIEEKQGNIPVTIEM
jgi:hypothetical protein